MQAVKQASETKSAKKSTLKAKLSQQTTQEKSAGFSFSQVPFSPIQLGSIQTKLTIGAPNDRYEREADSMANRIMRMPQSFSGAEGLSTSQPSIQRKCKACAGEEDIQRKPLMLKSEGGTPVATPALANQLSRSKGGGNPLPSNTNQFMSQAFGTDFSSVRIHADNRAAQMNQGLQARAFTHGADIYFNRGEYRPNAASGKHLLAHELTHVVQQGGGISTSIQRQNSTAACSDGMKQITVDLISFEGSNRDPYSDLAHANRIYQPCCVEFVLGQGRSASSTVYGPLMGGDTTFERARCGVDSTEEQDLIPAVTTAFNLNGDLRVFYFERINPSARATSHPQYCASALTRNYVYMTNGAADRTLAHEFGHILLNGFFHNLPADNLMHPSNTATGSNLTASQCATIRSF